jgi:hypothetical protein
MRNDASCGFVRGTPDSWADERTGGVQKAALNQLLLCRRSILYVPARSLRRPETIRKNKFEQKHM